MSVSDPLLPEAPIYEDPDPVTRQQVNQAIMDVEDMHPLRSRVYLDHIIPPLRIFRSCIKRKPDFKHSLRKTLLAEMKIKMPKSENTIIDDPFLILGYGVNAYFDIMISLAIACLTITVFCIPLYRGYAFNDEKGLQMDGKYVINQWSLGNMAGSNIFCGQKRIGTSNMPISCPMGKMVINETSAQLGIMSMNVAQKIHCTEESIWGASDETTVSNCTANMNYDAFYTQLKTNCDGKVECDVNLDNLLSSTADSETQAQCGDEAFVYVQAPCLIEASDAGERRLFGLLIGCIAVFIYLFTVVYYDYIKSVQMNTYVDWDVKTITAGDYTIEFDLDVETYDYWKKYYYDQTNPVTENAQFKLYV